MHWHLITISFGALALYYEDQGGFWWYTSQALFVISLCCVNIVLKGPDEEYGDSEGDQVIDDINRIDCGLTVDKAMSSEPVLDIFTLEKGKDYD